MSDYILSSNMNLPVPVVGVDAGPDWANNINSSLTLIDQHNHAAGSGVPINPGGLNINADLPFNNNNLTLARSLRLYTQGAVLSGASDLNCLYNVGVDLYYNDGNGNNIRITQSGGVAGSPGTISSLTSPASASYNSGLSKFIWQSAANTPAYMDCASIILRNFVANSYGMTLNPPNSMGSNFSVTFPTLPASQKIMTIDNAGNMGAVYDVDNSTIQISSNLLQVNSNNLSVPTGAIQNSAVTTAKIAATAVTQDKLQARTASTSATLGNIAVSASCGSFNITTSLTQITNMSITLVASGNRPIVVKMISDGTNAPAYMQASGACTIFFYKDTVQTDSQLYGSTAGNWPTSSVEFVDMAPSAGSHTYSLYAQMSSSTGNIRYSKLIAYEM